VCVCVLPKRSHTVAGGPAHNEAPLWVGAPLTHLVQAVGRPHLTHTHLGLRLEVVGRSVEHTHRKRERERERPHLDSGVNL